MFGHININPKGSKWVAVRMYKRKDDGASGESICPERIVSTNHCIYLGNVTLRCELELGLRAEVNIYPNN